MIERVEHIREGGSCSDSEDTRHSYIEIEGEGGSGSDSKDRTHRRGREGVVVIARIQHIAT